MKKGSVKSLLFNPAQHAADLGGRQDYQMPKKRSQVTVFLQVEVQWDSDGAS